jgi:N-acetylglucosamine-6-sulfatase
VFAPTAPHEPAVPAPTDTRLFGTLPAWDPPAFNEADLSDKPRHVRDLPPLGPQQMAELEQLRRNQYRSLRSVDRAVGLLLDALDDTDRLDDAVVIFTSDNGLLWGEHRWLKKEVPYEEAIRVPFVVRADAIATVSADEHVVGNIDVAPTIAEAAGVELPTADGASVLPLLRGETPRWRSALLIEHVRGTNPIPTYCAIRTANQLYVRYETGERELYDLMVDPAQLDDLAGARPALEERLETILRGLCDPPPPGFTDDGGPVMVVVALAATLGTAGVARLGLRRTVRR